MLFEVKNYKPHVTDEPVTSLKEIRRDLNSVFEEIPCIKKAGVFGKWAAGEAGEGDPIGVVIFPDWRYGISTRGLWDYANRLLYYLGRDVDIVVDRRFNRDAHPETKILYGRAEWRIEEIEHAIDVAEQAARHASTMLTMEGLRHGMASDIADDASRTAWCGLFAALTAMGGWEAMEPSIATTYERARDKGAIESAHFVARACRDLSYFSELAEIGIPMRVADALLAVYDANLVADALRADGRPASRILVADPDVLELMRTLELVPR